MLAALFLLFTLVTMTLALVYTGAYLYFKRKEGMWLAGCEKLALEQKTEAEQAIGDQWKEEEKVVVSQEVMNPEAEPLPTPAERRFIEAQQVAEHLAATLEANVFDPELSYVEGDGPDGKVRAPVHVPVRAVVEKLLGEPVPDAKVFADISEKLAWEKAGGILEKLDLSKMPPEFLDKLFLRCKAQMETNATMAESKRIDDLYTKAKQILDEEKADEEFYRQACEEAKHDHDPVIIPSVFGCDPSLPSSETVFMTYDKVLEKVEKASPAPKKVKKPRKRTRK